MDYTFKHLQEQAAAPLNQLPPEIMSHIFKYLEQRDQLSSRLVNKKWADVVLNVAELYGTITDSDDSFWIMSNFSSKDKKMQRIHFEDLSENSISKITYCDGEPKLVILIPLAREISLGKGISAANLDTILLNHTANITSFSIGAFAFADLDAVNTHLDEYINNFGHVTKFKFCVQPTPQMGIDKVYGSGEDLRFENHITNLTAFLQCAKMRRLTELHISVVMPYPNAPNTKNLHDEFISAVADFLCDHEQGIKTLSVSIDGNMSKPLLEHLPILKKVTSFTFACGFFANPDAPANTSDKEQLITTLSSFKNVKYIDYQCNGVSCDNWFEIFNNYSQLEVVKLGILVVDPEVFAQRPRQFQLKKNKLLTRATFTVSMDNMNQKIHFTSWLIRLAPNLRVLSLRAPVTFNLTQGMLVMLIKELEQLRQVSISSTIVSVNGKAFCLQEQLPGVPISITQEFEGILSSVCVKIERPKLNNENSDGTPNPVLPSNSST